MLHLTKLAVGIRDIAHLKAVQSSRVQAEPDLRHRTRHLPRRSADIVGGGSIYWVVAGTMLVRQRLRDIVPDRREDGSACAGLVLDPELVQVEGRPVKPFQGWRYLQPDAAPPDLTEDGDLPGALPAALRSQLRALALI